MDPSQSYSGQGKISLCAPETADPLRSETKSYGERPHAGAKGSLTLVGGSLAFAPPAEPIPCEWDDAISQITRGLGLNAGWTASASPWSLFERARRAVSAGGETQAPILAPWRAVAPTAFQLDQPCEAAPDAKWVASYLFDFGPTCSTKPGPIDLTLMSPCPEVCVCEDAKIGSLPRTSVLASMVRAAATEGRKNLAIVVQEPARATLATRLLAFDASLNETALDVEFVSIEEAVVSVQRGSFAWDAVIAMPNLRGVLFAMLAQHAGVLGPWPMLWFDRGLRAVTCEALPGAGRSIHLDATLLVQSLALLARHAGHHYAARRLYEGWAGVRDGGVVTAARTSLAPYVNEIDEAAFIDQVIHERPSQTRPLPLWKGLVRQENEARKTERPVRLSLVT